MAQGTNVFDEVEQDQKQATTPAPAKAPAAAAPAQASGNVFDQVEHEQKTAQPDQTQPTQFEQDRAPASTWQKLTAPYDPGAEKYGKAGRFLSAVGGAVMSAPQGAWQMIAHPFKAGAEMGKDIGEAANAWTTDTPTGFKINREMLKAAPSVLPEALGQGVGTVAGNEAIGAVPGAVKSIPKVAADASQAWTDFRTPARVASADKMFSNVQRPGINDIGYAARQTAAMPDLQEIAHKNPELTNPRDAVDAIDAHIDDLNQPVREAAKAVQPDKWNDKRVDISGPLMDAVQRKFAESPGTFTEGEMEKGAAAVQERMKPPTSPEGWSPMEEENLRKKLNDETSAYYKMKTSDRLASGRDAEMAAKKAAADELRDHLYGTEGEPGVLETSAGVEGDTRALRQRIGNLVAVRNNWERSIVRAEATGDWSAIKAMTTRNPVGAVMSGGIGGIMGLMLGGPMGGVTGTIIGEGGNALHSYMTSKNPNLNIEKGFNTLRKTTPPNLPGVSAPLVPPGIPRTNPATQIPLGLMPESDTSLAPLGETRPTLPRKPAPPHTPITGEQVPLGLWPESEDRLMPLGETRGNMKLPEPRPPLIQGEQVPLNLWPESETKLAPLGETRPSKWKKVKKSDE